MSNLQKSFIKAQKATTRHSLLLRRSKFFTLTQKRKTYLDPGFQTLSITGLECFLNVSQIDFGTTDNNTNQGFVFSSHASHRIMETFSEVIDLGFDAFYCNRNEFRLALNIIGFSASITYRSTKIPSQHFRRTHA